MAKSYNNHHILCQSRNGSNIRENKVKLDIRHHNALHMLFENRTPPEQIKRILWIASTALTEEVKSDIIKILDTKDLEYWYNKWILLKK